MSVDYAIANTANQYIQGGLEITTAKNGGNVTVTVKLYLRRTNSYSGPTYDSNLSRSITIDGTTTSGSGAITVAGGQQNVWQGPILTASKTFTGNSKKIKISWNSSGIASNMLTGSGSTDFTVPAGHIAPSGGYITITGKTYNSVTAKVGVGSFGVPNTNSELIFKVLTEAYVAGKPTRENSKLANGATTTVSNNSTAFEGGITIIGNKTYHTGVYASNGALDYRYQGPTFTTPCPPLSALSVGTQTYNTYNTTKTVINWSRQADGNALARTLNYRYSTDDGSSWSSWTSVGEVANSATSGSFTITGLPTGKSVALQVKLTTSAGDSETKTLNFTTLGTHTAPNFKNFTFKDSNSKVTALTGSAQIFIQNQSTPVVTIPVSDKATGNQSIAMSGYNIAFSGQNYFMDYSATEDVSKTLSAPTQGETLVLAVLAVDALQSATQVAKDVKVYPWSEPVIAASVTRENGFEASSTLAIKGTYAPIVIDGATKNSLAVKYRYKKSSSSEWSAWEERPITLSNGNWSTTNLVKSFDNASQWDIEISATDQFTTTTVKLTLSVGVPKFYIDKNGRIAIGKRPEKPLTSGNNGQLEVDGDVYADRVISDKSTNTYLAGNRGEAIINSTAGAGNYVMLAKLNSTNGVFTDGVYQGRRELHYTAKSTIDAGTNGVTKNATLLDESGNTSFPGFVSSANGRLMASHVGQIIMSTNLTTAAAVQNIYGGTWVTWGAGRVPVGVNTSETEFNAVNKTGGAKSVTLTVEQIPSHSHGTWASYSNTSSNNKINLGSTYWLGTSDSTAATGGGQSHNNLQPYQTCYFWRRTA